MFVVVLCVVVPAPLPHRSGRGFDEAVKTCRAALTQRAPLPAVTSAQRQIRMPDGVARPRSGPLSRSASIPPVAGRLRCDDLRGDLHRTVVAVLPELLRRSRVLEQHSVNVEGVKVTGTIAIDGLTTLERSSLPEAFREFWVSLIGFMKERDITVVFSSTRALGMDAESTTEAHISTMTDAILVLRYVEGGGEAHRGLLVLKMRGTDHDKRIREYRITSAGLSIEGPMESVAGFIPGAATMSSGAPRTPAG